MKTISIKLTMKTMSMKTKTTLKTTSSMNTKPKTTTNTKTALKTTLISMMAKIKTTKTMLMKTKTALRTTSMRIQTLQQIILINKYRLSLQQITESLIPNGITYLYEPIDCVCSPFGRCVVIVGCVRERSLNRGRDANRRASNSI